MRSLLSRARSLWTGVRATDLDAEMQEEFAHHIELRAADLQRAGLAADEALRQARLEFGGTYNHQQRAREARGLGWFDGLRFSWLDFRLGLRMLRKYPGLAVMSSVAMGVAIAIGAGGFTLLSLVNRVDLPLHEGDRIVGIRLWNVETWSPERRILHDVADWRALRSVEDIGIFRRVARNVVDDEGRAETVRGAEMSASGFRVARVQPLLGRYLVEDDERPGAPPVIVIGHDLWRHRFAADSAVIGRTMRFGTQPYTIVGVMPRGFQFPVSYEVWIAPTAYADGYKRREGPAFFAFGRLRAGATIEEARTELAARTAAAASVHPESERSIEPRVLPFAQSYADLDAPWALLAMAVVRVILLFLLLVICVNVAVLVFARTATRQGEVAVRSALGASRSRIVAQLFGEALVLSVVGAAIGLGILRAIASWLDSMLMQLVDLELPFWLRFEVSGVTLAYAVALGVLAATIIGVIPALRVTGKRVQHSLQRLASGNASIRLGWGWTALIVAELALTVAILPAAFRFTSAWAITTLGGPGFAAEEYLTANVSLELEDRAGAPDRVGDPPPDEVHALRARLARARAQLSDRLAREPEVMEVTFARLTPGGEDPRYVEVDSVTPVDSSWLTPRELARRVRYPVARDANVDASFLRTFDVRLIAGRGFAVADADAPVVIVNRSFVDSLLDGHSAIGRRVRSVWPSREGVETGPWQVIIGVVEDFPARPVFDRTRAATYKLESALELFPSTAILRTRGDPAAFGPRLRAIAREADPAFVVRHVSTLDAQIRSTNVPLQWLTIGLGVVTLSVLMLSAAGIYALMSVIVTQRRREIGIRIALGASHRRVLSNIFGRAALQLGIGIAVGIGLAAVINSVTDGQSLGGRSLQLFTIVALFMTAVGALAALQPARRGLSIQPITVLKEE